MVVRIDSAAQARRLARAATSAGVRVESGAGAGPGTCHPTEMLHLSPLQKPGRPRPDHPAQLAGDVRPRCRGLGQQGQVKGLGHALAADGWEVVHCAGSGHVSGVAGIPQGSAHVPDVGVQSQSSWPLSVRISFSTDLYARSRLIPSARELAARRHSRHRSAQSAMQSACQPLGLT